MQEMVANPVPLDPELAKYVYDQEDSVLGPCVKHPLVYSMMHVPMFNKMVNESLRVKKIAVAEALKDEEWHSYVFLHERPWRVVAFQAIADRMSDADYWRLLSTIWTDSENIRENPRQWERLLKADRPDRHLIMKDHEREALEAMDAVIPVYQGHTVRRHDGWSWTTDRWKAVWFGHRFADLEQSRPALTTGHVRKSDVIAFFTARGESEIVVPRGKVKGKEVAELPPRSETK